MGARILYERFGQRVARVSEAVGDIHRKNVLKRVRAAAQALFQHQGQTLETLFQVVKDMVSLGQWRALAYVEQLAYDETKLDVRVYYEGDKEATREAAAVFVVEQKWAMVIEELPFLLSDAVQGDTNTQITIFEGYLSPSVRSAQAATGECIAGVLRSVSPTPVGAGTLFKQAIRLSETDEDGANARAEAIVLNDRQGIGEEFLYLRSLCLAHKLHNCATKSWVLQGRGCHRHDPHMQNSGIGWLYASTACVHRRAHREPLEGLALGSPKSFSHCRCLQTTLGQALCSPAKHTRKLAAFNAAIDFFNGDWTTTEISHWCLGPACCKSPDQCAVKGQLLFRGLLKAVAPRMFSRANWVEWHRSLGFFGIAAGLHSLILDAFRHAFRAQGCFTGQTFNPVVLSMNQVWQSTALRQRATVLFWRLCNQHQSRKLGISQGRGHQGGETPRVCRLHYASCNEGFWSTSG